MVLTCTEALFPNVENQRSVQWEILWPTLMIPFWLFISIWWYLSALNFIQSIVRVFDWYSMIDSSFSISCFTNRKLDFSVFRVHQFLELRAFIQILSVYFGYIIHRYLTVFRYYPTSHDVKYLRALLQYLRVWSNSQHLVQYIRLRTYGRTNNLRPNIITKSDNVVLIKVIHTREQGEILFTIALSLAFNLNTSIISTFEFALAPTNTQIPLKSSLISFSTGNLRRPSISFELSGT